MYKRLLKIATLLLLFFVAFILFRPTTTIEDKLKLNKTDVESPVNIFVADSELNILNKIITDYNNENKTKITLNQDKSNADIIIDKDPGKSLPIKVSKLINNKKIKDCLCNDYLTIYYDRLLVLANRQLLSEFSFLDSPNTWDGILEFCKKINKESIAKLDPSCINLSGSEIENDVLANLVYQNTGTLDFNTNKEKSVAAYSFYSSFNDENKENYAFDNTNENAKDLFKQKKLALLLIKSSEINNYLSEVDFETDISNFPQIDGNTSVQLVNGIGVSLIKNKDNTVSQDFIRYLFNKQNQNYFYEQAHYLPFDNKVRSLNDLPLPIEASSKDTKALIDNLKNN